MAIHILWVVCMSQTSIFFWNLGILEAREFWWCKGWDLPGLTWSWRRCGRVQCALWPIFWKEPFEVGLLTSEGHGDKDRVFLGKCNGHFGRVVCDKFSILWGMSRWYQVHPHRKNSRYFVNNSCGCFQMLGWWANRLEKSFFSKAEVVWFHVDWGVPRHRIARVSSYNWAASIGGGDKLSCKSLIEEEYVWITYWRKLQINTWCERNMRFLRNLQSIHLRPIHWSNLQKRSFNYPWLGTVMMSPFWQQPTRLSWWSAQLKQWILHHKCPVKLS